MRVLGSQPLDLLQSQKILTGLRQSLHQEELQTDPRIGRQVVYELDYIIIIIYGQISKFLRQCLFTMLLNMGRTPACEINCSVVQETNHEC